jgi:hypothetical protein
MRCGDYAVSQVLVGLHRVGVVGLRQACAKIAASGLVEREEIVDALLEELAADNFIIDSQIEAYRIALWREYLRSQGRELSEFFSRIEVTVRGNAGEDRDRLIELFRSVLAEFELQPDLDLAAPVDDGSAPQIVIGDTTVATGFPTRRALKTTIRQRLSDW